MGLKVIYIFSHDSIGLGEDGPTHQPIEQLAGTEGQPGQRSLSRCHSLTLSLSTTQSFYSCRIVSLFVGQALQQSIIISCNWRAQKLGKIRSLHADGLKCSPASRLTHHRLRYELVARLQQISIGDNNRLLSFQSTLGVPNSEFRQLGFYLRAPTTVAFLY